MLAKDSTMLAAHDVALKAELRRQQIHDYAAALIDSRSYFGARPEDMANPAKNAGRLLPEEIFLKKLSRILPGGQLNVSQHPENPYIHYLEIPGHAREHALSYICEPMGGVLPEYSTIGVKRVAVYDTETETPHFDRADLPKYRELVPVTIKGSEVRGPIDETTGEAELYTAPDEIIERWQYDPNDLLPGQHWEYEAQTEVLRGWRTILAMLVQEGVLTPEIVEREFGVAARASWRALLGKTLH